ncbi:MAG: COG1361 family protein [Candidatus Methanofastidiosia archaeon]
MKRSFAIFFVLMLFLPAIIFAINGDFVIFLTTENISPEKVYAGDTVYLTISVENASLDEGEKLWDAKIFVDQDVMSEQVASNIVINEPDGISIEYTGNEHPGKEIWPGESEVGILSITVKGDAPGGSYPIPVVLTGKRGPCPEGCSPWREEPLYVSVKVIHGIPALSATFPEENTAVFGDTLTIPFTLKNLGSSEALDILPEMILDQPSFVGQVNIQDNKNNLMAGESIDASIAIITSSLGTGEFFLEVKVHYKDSKDKTYLLTKNVAFSILESGKKTYEELGNEAFQSGEDYFTNQEYELAIEFYSKAKGFYEAANLLQNSLQCQQKIEESFTLLKESQQPPPQQFKNRNYLLIVGLVMGALAAFLGLAAGIAKAKSRKQKILL